MTEIVKDLADLRREYKVRPLRRQDLDPNPFALFNRWFDEATDVEAMDANAMTLATVSADGQPSARTVLLKYYDETGFVFYTNLGSCKADEIAGNPRVALLFYWHELHRQVHITGTAARISAAETLKYFVRRPRDSQIGAWVSRQSHLISSRSVLEMEFAKMKEKFAAGDVPLPSFWGGYRITPTAFEFWQGRESRLHDRFVYRAANNDAWDIDRLAP
ncbi:MAG: pyridoxamine 5'-phosphate oxidase [Gammaproteobacteria bacterium]|nr:pyridoxamine 5'-phosphate oxidase [Gammaproteobacteria bacterium]